MSVFDDIRSIPFEDVARQYGIVVTRNHTCRCPFHEDGHPSMKIYQDHGYCFACGAYADGAKLVAHLYNITPVDGARKIANDFGISIHKVTAGEINLAQKRRQEELRREAYVSQAWKFGLLILDTLRRWESEAQINTPEDFENAPETFVFALHNKDYVDYLLEEYNDQKQSELYQWLLEVKFVEEMNKIAIKMKDIGGKK